MVWHGLVHRDSKKVVVIDSAAETGIHEQNAERFTDGMTARHRCVYGRNSV